MYNLCLTLRNFYFIINLFYKQLFYRMFYILNFFHLLFHLSMSFIYFFSKALNLLSSGSANILPSDQTINLMKLLLFIKIAFFVGCSRESLLLSNYAASIYCHYVKILKEKVHQTNECIANEEKEKYKIPA